jgi:hypothetical protein
MICGAVASETGYYDIQTQLGLYDAEIDEGIGGLQRLPGAWEYDSSVVDGRGYSVIGSEYVRVYTHPDYPSDIQFEYPSFIAGFTDKTGDKFHFFPVPGPYNYRSQIVKQIDHVGGGYSEVSYDDRGNVTLLERFNIAGSDSIPQSANYDAVCANQLTCNQPNWVIDPEGNQTDYEYNPVHGSVTKITAPADDHGVRPQIRYYYEQRSPWLKSSNGGYVASGTPIWVLTQEEYCRTSAASGNGCSAGSADEVVTTYDYGPDSGPNNLWLRGKTVTSEGVSLRTCYTYDVFGNQHTETTPNANLTSCP